MTYQAKIQSIKTSMTLEQVEESGNEESGDSSKHSVVGKQPDDTSLRLPSGKILSKGTSRAQAQQHKRPSEIDASTS